MADTDPRGFWDAMDAIDPDEYEAQTRAEGAWPAEERPPLTIPTDPAEREAWAEEFTDDLMAGEQGGIGLGWHDERRRG